MIVLGWPPDLALVAVAFLSWCSRGFTQDLASALPSSNSAWATAHGCWQALVEIKHAWAWLNRFPTGFQIHTPPSATASNLPGLNSVRAVITFSLRRFQTDPAPRSRIIHRSASTPEGTPRSARRPALRRPARRAYQHPRPAPRSRRMCECLSVSALSKGARSSRLPIPTDQSPAAPIGVSNRLIKVLINH